MSRFTEQRLEQAIITLLGEQGYPHVPGESIARSPQEVLLKDDLRAYLASQYPTFWDNRDDIKAELKVDLIILLAQHGYPPVDCDEVYKEIFEQATNFKKYRGQA
ncbi:type I restriction enzyme endonuclease domain-containing protein [Thiothrix winogradskyi]|uniref:DUF3387 domain-containing protein n=1 Tax=Thiothrix winogradskyi TaxID=96472 RepID=A0ABY3T802_9GAMM|nr:type I restriction enzyme endonuclease domain-containing protein [Thiothrix winogradskyi]UJS26559.1 DUF3387 domain-containing protein [Thiothrix winogradskyi]